MVDYNGSVELDKPTNSDKDVRKKAENKQKKFTKSQVLTRFTSCGRCSLFLASYRINYEEPALDTAIANSNGNWLALPWNPNLKKLLVKSFGCHLDTEIYYFESTCPECRGKYRFSEPHQDEPGNLSFRI